MTAQIIHVAAYQRRKPQKPAVYLAKHEQLGAEVRSMFSALEQAVEEWARDFPEQMSREFSAPYRWDV